jgi:hypothetical protein
VMPDGRVLPRPPESRGDEPLARGNRTRPARRSHPAGVLVRGRDSYRVPHLATICQVIVLLSATKR